MGSRSGIVYPTSSPSAVWAWSSTKSRMQSQTRRVLYSVEVVHRICTAFIQHIFIPHLPRYELADRLNDVRLSDRIFAFRLSAFFWPSPAALAIHKSWRVQGFMP